MNTNIMSYRNKWITVLAREAGLVVSLTALTCLAAKISIPLPWTPVPVTMQVAAVLFAGTACGARRGLYSQLLYLGLGLMGWPVFSSVTEAFTTPMLSPSFGYVLAYPLAAYVAGRWYKPKTRWAAALVAVGLIYLVGISWIVLVTRAVSESWTWSWVLLAGLWTFLPFDLVKAALAVLSARSVRRRLGN